MDFEKGYVYELMDKGGPTDNRQPYFRAFRVYARQRQELDQDSKITLPEHIHRSGRRVEWPVWMFLAAGLS